MRLLHTSDWHLGRSDGVTSLYGDQKFFIDEICRIVRERGADGVLIAGDVFDRALSSADAVKLYDYAMTELCLGCGVQVFIIAGNHDSAERLSSCGELLSRAGLHIKGELKSDVSPLVMQNTEIFMLPWITEEKVRSVFPSRRDEITDLPSACAVVTSEMKKNFSAGKRHIILSHAFISGTETSESDRSAVIGFASQVNAEVFEGFDYVALGHLHAPQQVGDKIRYCGTPMPYSFGREESQTKGVVIIDTDTLTQEFVPLSLMHRRTTLEGTLKEIMEYKCGDDVRNGYVRLRITDSYIGLETLAELRELYAHPIEVSGKSFTSDSEEISLSAEELEELQSDPVEIFRYFCREEINEEPDGHLIDLFLRAMEESEREERL